MPAHLPLLAPSEGAVCCGTVTGSVISVEDAERTARVFKALGDPTRVRLLSLIAASADGAIGPGLSVRGGVSGQVLRRDMDSVTAFAGLSLAF